MRDAMLDWMEVGYETTYGFPISTMTFNLRWLETVLDLGHGICM